MASRQHRMNGRATGSSRPARQATPPTSTTRGPVPTELGNQAISRLFGRGSVADDASSSRTLMPEAPAPSVVRANGATLATVYFPQGDFLLADARSVALLEQLSEELRFLVEPTVTVDGYASSEGTDTDNVKLSDNRRTAVIALLRAHAQAVTFGGSAHGEADPAEPEIGSGAELEGHRARNRRVEIFISPRLSPAQEPDLRPPQREETLEERMNRTLKEPVPTGPPDISIGEAAGRKFDEAVDDLLRKTDLSKEWRDRIRGAAHDAAKAGVGKLIDQAVDQAPLGTAEREGLKQGIRALLQAPVVRP
jgi:outer membrane protein OmpA-like peptidoglycan-associated protein